MSRMDTLSLGERPVPDRVLRGGSAIDPLPEAAEVDRAGLWRNRLRDWGAGLVAASLSGLVVVNAVMMQPPSAGAPLPERRPSGLSSGVEKPRPVTTRITPSAVEPRPVATGGATSGALGYLSIKTSVSGMPVPMVPAAAVAGNLRHDPRPGDGLRVPRMAMGVTDPADSTASIRPPAEVPASPRVLGVQKALSRLGYGPLKPDGVTGAGTRAAIQRFQRDRGLSADGEISDRLLRELAAVAGPVN